jgi:hypothetical protein
LVKQNQNPKRFGKQPTYMQPFRNVFVLFMLGVCLGFLIPSTLMKEERKHLDIRRIGLLLMALLSDGFME